MKITRQEVEYVARLARLDLTEQEKTVFTSQLSSILAYVEKLNELDTSGIEPTSHVIDIINVTRPDETRDSLSQDAALANAPDKTAGHFRVPKIIE